MEAPWAVLEASSGPLGPSWAILRPSKAVLSAYWAVLEASWGHLSRLGGYFGRLRNILEAILGHLGRLGSDWANGERNFPGRPKSFPGPSGWPAGSAEAPTRIRRPLLIHHRGAWRAEPSRFWFWFFFQNNSPWGFGPSHRPPGRGGCKRFSCPRRPQDGLQDGQDGPRWPPRCLEDGQDGLQDG